MIATSALVAALVADHEHHVIARPHLAAMRRVPAIVVAETYAQLRRTFGQTAADAARLLAPFCSGADQVLPTTSQVVISVVGRAEELDLGGNIHDAMIAQTCLEHRVPLVTLDRNQHRIALALGAESRHLLS